MKSENKKKTYKYDNIRNIRISIEIIILILMMIGNALGENFRIHTTIGVSGFERFEKPVDIDINFTQLLKDIGKSGTINESSIYVAETNSARTVIDSSVPFQFDKATGYNPTTKASGTVVFIMKGTTLSTAKRYYYIYFDTGSSSPHAPVAQQLSLTDNVMDQGQSSYKIDITDSSFFFQKTAGGFSSWNDKSGNDWINWNPANGPAGKYRGVPNAVNPEAVFHPGFYCCTSSIVSKGPIKIRIRTINGTKWEALWDFYPRYATMTMTKMGHNYWFLYEGTPGGVLEPTKDFMFRSNGVKTLLSQSWTGDIPNNEWAYFSDPSVGTTGRSLFVTHSEDDTLQDLYWPHTGLMTVFGFGRVEQNLGKLLSYVPQHFTIGLIDGTDFVQNSKLINSAYKGLTITKNATEQYGGGTSSSITVTSPNGGETWARNVSHTIRWTYTGNPGSYVKIELLKGGSLNRVISSSTANDGSYVWTTPLSQILGTDFKIRITSTSNPSYKDESNNNFKIY